MLYNPKTDLSFWLRDYAAQTKILKASISSMDFLRETYRPALRAAGELLTYLDFNEMELDLDTRCMILDIIRELQDEVTFYQNILKEGFSAYDSNS